jgi:hypothetical protein
MSLSKEEAVQLMCETVNNFNRQVAASQNMDINKIEEHITTQADQLKYMNGLLYDALLQADVITESY